MHAFRYQLLILVLMIVLCMTCTLTPAVLVHTRQEIEIPMPDTHPDTQEQVKLSADLYLPESGEAPWPVILIQTPYVKELTYTNILTSRSDDPLYRTSDYAFVIMDWRGYGISASKDMRYTGAPSTGEDGYEAVEWIAAQSWCDGNVGTWGASALGNVQMKTAAEQPPHLVCCVPIVYHYREWYDLYFQGGVYTRNRSEFVSDYFGAGTIARSHPQKDATWDFVEDFSGDPSLIDVPMLHISGWYDHEVLQTMREYKAIQTTGGDNARGDQKILIGPWSHSEIGSLEQLELSYPAAQHESSLEALRFFDYYMRGIENGWPGRAPIRFFQTNEDTWELCDEWPPEGVASRTLHLHEDGSLEVTMPQSSSAVAEYVSDPSDPVYSVCGALLNSEYGNQGPADLSSLEGRQDVLVFTTGVLSVPMRIAGNATAELWIECDAVDTDVALRLTQVYPDGRSMWLVDAVRRASLRNGFRVKEPLEQGTVYSIPVEFPPFAATIPAGHRLRLLVMPSNYDMFDVNMQDGSDFSDEEGATATIASVTLHMNSQYPSRLNLPLRSVYPDASLWSMY